MKKISLVKIRIYRYLHEADIARTALEAQGIQAFIDSRYLSTINWIYSSMDGIGLRVNASDVKKALKILGPEETVKRTNSKKMKSSIKLYVLIVALLLLAWIIFAGLGFRF